MTLPRDYANQVCSAARSLEIVGERWTLLIVRDAFYGVRRFSDFAVHLQVPRAVLTERLTALVQDGILDRVPGPGRRDEYGLTAKGVDLWPVVRSLMVWGDEYYGRAEGPRRLFRHAADDGQLDGYGICAECGKHVPVPEILVLPGVLSYEPGNAPNPVTEALDAPRRLLEPLVMPTGRAARAVA
ncbi:MAG TPA: helix-turn-helix domain-containing protein [Actinocrinis sp.]|nr:helix-turn-helix domain-containing protein [Actinocrinis sp.]